jgi:sulfur relay (sulfurtransferase) complex TusBCD TusD component (DsrE family)
MGSFLVVGSRDLTEYINGQYVPLVVEGLREKGHEVTLFLIENGVIAARAGSTSGQVLNGLAQKGEHVFAEDVSCRARGVQRLTQGVALSDLDALADSIAEGFDNIVWY